MKIIQRANYEILKTFASQESVHYVSQIHVLNLDKRQLWHLPRVGNDDKYLIHRQIEKHDIDIVIL